MALASALTRSNSEFCQGPLWIARRTERYSLPVASLPLDRVNIVNRAFVSECYLCAAGNPHTRSPGILPARGFFYLRIIRGASASRCRQRSRLMHGPTLLGLMPSSHSVIAEYVCFDFQLSKTVLENITNADDPHELIAVLDRHMANTPHGHQLHDVSHAVLR